MDDNSVTIAGNLTADPTLKYTATGTAVASFRLAQTPRYLDKASGLWRDGESLFVTVSCWRGLAENVAASMRRGDRVLVKGRLRQREFEPVPGEHKTVIEIEADLVGPELARAIATPRKVSREPLQIPVHDPAARPDAGISPTTMAFGEAPAGTPGLSGELEGDDPEQAGHPVADPDSDPDADPDREGSGDPVAA